MAADLRVETAAAVRRNANHLSTICFRKLRNKSLPPYLVGWYRFGTRSGSRSDLCTRSYQIWYRSWYRSGTNLVPLWYQYCANLNLVPVWDQIWYQSGSKSGNKSDSKSRIKSGTNLVYQKPPVILFCKVVNPCVGGITPPGVYHPTLTPSIPRGLS
jgi:hypothetical protein